MAGTKAQQLNLLEGPLFVKIIRFIIPLILTNLLQQLYNAADMIIVGMSGVSGALGAIGTTGHVINLILNSIIGVSVGANVVVARCIGAGDRGETEKAVHTALTVSVIFGIAACAIGQALCRPMLILLGDEGRVLELACLYTRIYFAGAPFTAVTNFSIAIFRAKGDTKTPLYVLALSGFTNVILNLFFVLVCGMSVDGVSLATVISNMLSAVILVTKLVRSDDWCRVQLKKLKLHMKAFKKILLVGIPSGIQGALFSISNLTIQSSVIGINNRMYPGGSAVIDGNAAASNMEHLVYAATTAITQASITFTSQHYGAGKYRRIGKVIWNCTLMTVLITGLLSGVILLFQNSLAGLFVSEPAALEVIAVRNGIMMSTYFLLGLMEVSVGILRGLGKSVTSSVITLIGACAFRVLWISFVFPLNPTLECVYISYPISWIATSVVSYTFVICVWKKLLKKEKTAAV